MKKHIFASTLIFLTVGCQPNTSNTLNSQTETEFQKGIRIESESDSKSGSQHGARPSEQLSTQPDIKAQVVANLRNLVLDATVRMQMDLSGTTDTSSEIQLLEKLFSSTAGPDNTIVHTALRENKIPLKVELKDLENISENEAEIAALALAFKNIAEIYQFDEASQNALSDAIRKRGSLLVPLASQKAMAKASSALLQEKTNALIKTFSLKKSPFCEPLQNLAQTAESFYSLDSDYTLPSVIQRKILYLRSSLSESLSKCSTDMEGTRKALAKILPEIVEAITYDRSGLELYLTPQNSFSWESLEDFKLKAFLLENAEVREAQGRTTDGNLSFNDLTCSIDGQVLDLIDYQKYPHGASAKFDYYVNDEAPLVLEKHTNQKGFNLSFHAKKMEVTYYQGLTLTKTDAESLVPSINLIAGDKTKFQLSFRANPDAVVSVLKCSVTAPAGNEARKF